MLLFYQKTTIMAILRKYELRGLLADRTSIVEQKPLVDLSNKKLLTPLFDIDV